MGDYILSLDQGTTSSRALIVDHKGDIVTVSQKEFTQHYPQPGWVEHNPMEIWESQLQCAKEAIDRVGGSNKIKAIGITNQRETSVLWDRKTGKPIGNAIVWQDRRTSSYCDQLKDEGLEPLIQQKTGLVIDAYFSASKIVWLLENLPGARAAAEAGNLAFGTIDSWLIWNLTGGKHHITDSSNASRTMIYNIHERCWDSELLDKLKIPSSLLPKVTPSSGELATTDAQWFGSSISISGIAGDQQAALFGQMCTERGMAKNTYGTGCFLMMNTGKTPIASTNKLITTIAWDLDGEVNYALEGSIFIGGAVVQWLRDELKIIKTSADVEKLAMSVEDNGGVYLVPAFVGLGAPHWDQYARGTIVGLTRGSNQGHIARAALEAIAYQSNDVLTAMEADAMFPIKELRVDGGASINNTLTQFQCDILNTNVSRPKNLETTALGAAYLAGLASKFWKDKEEIKALWGQDKLFTPSMASSERDEKIKLWNKAIKVARVWSSS